MDASITDAINEVIDAMGNPVSVYDVPYVLMGRYDGKDVTEIQHLVMSMVDLLTTPLGSMPTLREYGCALFDYIDRAANVPLIDLQYAVHLAIHRWEPRIRLTRTTLTVGDEIGTFYLNIYGEYLLEGRGVALQNIVLDFRKEIANNYQ